MDATPTDTNGQLYLKFICKWTHVVQTHDVHWSTVYPYTGIVFSDKNKWNTDTWHNIGESCNYASWWEPDTKGDILYDCIYMKSPE